jgi:EmrB/QacA subfamily drug resistance transporter
MPSAARARSAPTVAVACLATAMLMLDISVVNTALSDMAAGLGTGLSGLQWVVDAYTLPLAATVLTFGALADRVGRRGAFAAGLILFTLASAACGLAGDIGQLIAARAVQGVGAAILFATALALIAQACPSPAERVKALAVYGATIGGAFAIGPFVGGALTSAFGWRAIFLANVPIGAAALWIAVRYVAESRDPHARRIDWVGQATLIGGLFLLVLGLLRGNEDGWGSTGVVAALASATVLLLAFGVTQWRGREPMLPLRLLREPAFAGPQLAVFALAGSFFAIFLYLTLYMQTVLGLSPIETGLVYLPGTIVMFLVAGATAQLGTRISAGALVSAGLVLVTAGLVLFLLLGAGSSWTMVLPAELLACVGMGIFNPAASALALQALPEQQSGLAVGVNDTFRQAGVAVGIAALGALVPASAALGGDPAGYVAGLHDAALAAAALSAAGAIGTYALLVARPRRAAAAVGAVREVSRQYS